MFSVPLPHPIRVLLVDDQRAILAGVSELIHSESPHMTVVGQAQSGHEALERATSERPDVIVLDVNLGGEDGLELIPLLRAACEASIVIFSCLTDPSLPFRASQLGANSFISKGAPGENLLDVISAIARKDESANKSLYSTE